MNVGGGNYFRGEEVAPWIQGGGEDGGEEEGDEAEGEHEDRCCCGRQLDAGKMPNTNTIFRCVILYELHFRPCARVLRSNLALLIAFLLSTC